MELGSSYRSWIADDREAEFARAAERARMARERRTLENDSPARGDVAGGNLLSRLRHRRALGAQPVTR
ncbi:hypothetical protein [Homoserinibacter gongjuensis]|uniref:Uncharacterized protein n=1 Tax=Homoserinibacter gongjuensis TaxID=1162968 RepID=A0ABQ6K0X2_9MICO|nr:hypothetical protein [Homoserinibacter gongjuensis]GMA92436.1 hypothetical protein GCM10025869_29650 [Homoserinibacter gongjuensis]